MHHQIRVAAIQMPHGPSLQTNLDEALQWLQRAQAQDVKLALLPEYFFATEGDDAADAAAEVRRALAEASATLDMAIAANVIDTVQGGKANVGVVYVGGTEILAQPKIHPMARETDDGIRGGTSLMAAPVLGHRVGMLVCSDILYPEAARILALQGTEILLNPVMSPHIREDPTRSAREALYVARAYDAAAFVIKAGGYRRGDPGIAGRSLVAAPWGLLAHYRDPFEPEVLVADLDLDRLAALRADRGRFPARRPEVYHPLTAPEETEE